MKLMKDLREEIITMQPLAGSRAGQGGLEGAESTWRRVGAAGGCRSKLLRWTKAGKQAVSDIPHKLVPNETPTTEQMIPLLDHIHSINLFGVISERERGLAGQLDPLEVCKFGSIVISTNCPSTAC